MKKPKYLSGVVAAATAVAVVAVVATPANAVTGQSTGVQASRDLGGVDNAASGGATGRGGTVVTLVTGDVVTVLEAAGARRGKCPQVSVVPAVKGGVVARTCGPDGHLRVIPSSAAPLVGTVLDPALFDVNTLIENGYDDAHSAQTPLIVQYTDQNEAKKAASGRSDAGLGGRLQNRKALSSIRGVAGRQSKRDAAGLRAALPDLRTKRSAAGVTKIMLDRKVTATPVTATSVATADMAQIGTPEAWQAGYTGKGVRVAVLDTGIDATHPDLAGRVVEAADFTDSGSTQDEHGHGTHVAGTIVGSGAASGGVRKGVAPDAQLVVGRVLDRTGHGKDSEIIAGMEWAAPRAGIVNMSLGEASGTDGLDPVAEAVEQLTKQYGTLFVVSAGNEGPGEQTVGSPGIAPSALTVGAVDGTGTVAEFSSRGPALATGSLKPDLLAPGVDTVSARAKGTSMGRIIDANYTAGSGTSMAAPHVAGAAALLKQRRPDWTASQIKADLTGTANPAKGGDPYVTGAGIVDIAQALDGPVTTTSTVDLGTLAYPQTGSTSTELGYANPAEQAATLVLTVTTADLGGNPLPVGAVSLSASTLDLPVGGKGSVVLKVDQAMVAGRRGFFAAKVTATDQRGQVLTTLVGFLVEGPSSTLTLHAAEWPEYETNNLYASAWVVDLDDPALFARAVQVPVGGTAEIRVPNGRYSVMGTILAMVRETDSGKSSAGALVGDPDMVIAQDTEVALDATTAPEVTAAVEGVETRTGGLAADVMQTGPRGWAWEASIWAFSSSERLFAAPMAVETGKLDTAVGASLYQPGDQPSPFAYELMLTGRSFPSDGRWVVSKAEQAKLAKVHQRFHHLDLEGAVASHARYGYTPWGTMLTETHTKKLPETRTDYLTPGVWHDEAFSTGLAKYGSLVAETPRTVVAGGSETKDWNRQPLHADWLGTADGDSFCQPSPITRSPGNLHVMLTPLVDVHGRYDCWSAEEIGNRHLALYRNGEQVGENDAWYGDFPMTREPATYRLTFDESFTTPQPLATAGSTSWTFRSAGPADDASIPVAMLALDYDLGLTQANRSTGGPATITVHQMAGTDPQQIQSAEVATSTDDGATWTSAPVTVAPGTSTAEGSFQTTLPTNAAGTTISLRVKVVGTDGSEIEQTMIRAYRAA